MVDWTKSMQRTYEYYVVDPATWKDKTKIDTITNATINRDSEAETLGSATFNCTHNLGECYIRVYLITIQNGLKEKHPLGTFLIQTPSLSFNGRVKSSSMDAYTPLIELKENPPPIGYSILKGENIMERAYQIIREHARAPVVRTYSDKTLDTDFVSNISDTWTTFTNDLVYNDKKELGLDEIGRIMFVAVQDLASLQPVWTYRDDNSSILQPDITYEQDLYKVPNVVEVTYSSGKDTYFARVVNDDSNSPTSTINRGREILCREINPQIGGIATEKQIKEYAVQLLKQKSTVVCSISYTHGYCPVRLGDCIRLDYNRADLRNIKAKVISQSIPCTPECQVTEKAIFTQKLWG